MRIVFLFHSNIRSGANLSLLRHAAYLSQVGHDVHAVFQLRLFDRSIGFVPNASGVQTFFADEYSPGTGRPIDIAIANWWESGYAITWLEAGSYVFYLHGEFQPLYTGRTHAFEVLIDLFYQADFHWFSVSDWIAEPVRAAGHPVTLLPNGVDCAAFATARPALPPKRKSLRVLVEGPAGVAFKRVNPTIAMLREVEGVEIVHMAADGSTPDPPVDHALGALPYDEVAGVYAACDLIVKLSSLEAFPMPVLEQFAAGGTAIVSAFRGHAALVEDGRNGLVVSLDEPFPEAASRLRDLLRDPSLLVRLRQGAVQTALRYDLDGIHQRFAAELERLAAADRLVPQRLEIVRRYADCVRDTVLLWVKDETRPAAEPTPELSPAKPLPAEPHPEPSPSGLVRRLFRARGLRAR